MCSSGVLWTLLFLGCICPSLAMMLSSLHYSVPEHSKVGITIGDIVGDLGLSDHDDLHIKFLQGSSAQLQDVLDISEGRLITNADIDRENFCPEEITCSIGVDVILKSKDIFHIVQVFVNIDDINDCEPKFSGDKVTVEVLENSPAGTRIPLPTASDLDSPVFGVESYYIQENSTTFELIHEPSLGKLHLALSSPLDREARGSLQLTVVAFDKGQPRNTGSVIVNVKVLDTNDNKPFFINMSTKAEILENLPPLTPIKKIRAFDPDLGNNGIIEYTLKGDRNTLSDFKINKTTGIIYTTKSLDRETKSNYEFTVIASDKGRIPLSTEAKIRIMVTDMNDNAPQVIIQSTSLQVSENKEPSAFVGHVTIIDNDFGKNGDVTCSVIPSTFRLDHVFKDEYRLLTTETLDREEKSKHDLTIECRDSGVIPKTTTFKGTVFVLDENDNIPMFSQPVQDVILTEDDINTQVITVLSATDKDDGVNGQIVYTVDPEQNHVVSVDSNGRVQSKVPLDHEMFKRMSIKFLATDSGNPPKSSSCLINVKIIDQNDEAPEFLYDNYQFQILENQIGGSTVGQVVAQDNDSPPYNVFDLILDIPSRNLFDIDGYGVIRTRQLLDREIQDRYSIIVTAVDAKDHKLSSTTKVEVKVTDQNDNVPVITFPSEENNTMVVTNAVDYMEAVGKIKASDDDSGMNGELKYYIYGDEADYFSIDAETGVIVLTEYNPVDMYSRKFTFDLIVSDRGSPARSASASLTIIFNITEDPEAEGRFGNLGTNALAAIIIGTISTVFIIFLAGAIVCFRRLGIRRYEKKNNPENGEHKRNNTDTGRHLVGSKTESTSAIIIPDLPETDLSSPNKITFMANPLQLYIDTARNAPNNDIQAKDNHSQGSDCLQSSPIDDAPVSPDSASSGQTDSGRGTIEDFRISAMSQIDSDDQTRPSIELPVPRRQVTRYKCPDCDRIHLPGVSDDSGPSSPNHNAPWWNASDLHQPCLHHHANHNHNHHNHHSCHGQVHHQHYHGSLHRNNCHNHPSYNHRNHHAPSGHHEHFNYPGHASHGGFEHMRESAIDINSIEQLMEQGSFIGLGSFSSPNIPSFIAGRNNFGNNDKYENRTMEI